MKRPPVPGQNRPSRPSGVRPISTIPAITRAVSDSLPGNRMPPSDARRFTAGSRRRRNALLIGAGTLVGIVLIVTGVVMSPLLTLTTVVVKGRESVPEKVIVGAVSDQIGQPLAFINFDAIGQRLGSVTRIQSYATEIQPPHTLVIRVVERQALGFVAVKNKWAVVDAAGVVIDSAANRPPRIPEISVASTSDPAFNAIADTLGALPQSVRKDVAQITAATRDSVRLTLRGVGHQIVWGSPENSALKLVVMNRALEVANQRTGRYEIDVSAPDNIVLRPIR